MSSSGFRCASGGVRLVSVTASRFGSYPSAKYKNARSQLVLRSRVLLLNRTMAKELITKAAFVAPKLTERGSIA
jgi:hypothetical protein